LRPGSTINFLSNDDTPLLAAGFVITGHLRIFNHKGHKGREEEDGGGSAAKAAKGKISYFMKKFCRKFKLYLVYTGNS
jgi:hypothetical protein